MDRFTWWPEAFPLQEISAATVAQTLVSGWIAHFGVPSTVVTDHGGQFESSLWTHLMTLLEKKGDPMKVGVGVGVGVGVDLMKVGVVGVGVGVG